MTTKILELANDFSTFHKKYNNEIIEHVLIENSNIDAGIIGNTAISTADIQIDNTVIRFATSRAIANNDLLSYDENQFKFVNKSLAEFGFVGASDILDLNSNTITANTVTISGDLLVHGTTTSLNTQSLLVEDNIVVYGSNNAADITDLGFAAKYNNGSADRYAGIFRDATDGKFYIFKDYNLEPPLSTLTGFNTSSMTATLYGDFEANNISIETGTANNLTVTSLTVNQNTVANNINLNDLTANNITANSLSGIALTDLGISDGTANQVLATDGTGNFSFAAQDFNNLINKPAAGATAAELQVVADDAFVNSIIFG